MSIGFVTNLQSFNRTIEREKARVKQQATLAYQKFVTNILVDLAKSTPQWSGDLAASWEVLVGENDAASGYVDSGFKRSPFEFPAPHFKGDMEAVNYALYANKLTISIIKWNSIVSVVNVNPTIKLIGNGVEDTSGTLPGNKLKYGLRPGNYIPGDVMAVNFVAHKYAHKRGYGDLNLGTSNEP